MRERLERFMQGRYGVDQLAQFMNIFLLILIVISFFFHSRIFNLIIFLLLIFTYSRMFSRNYQKRYEENLRYTQATARYRYWLSKQKDLWKQRKVYHIYRCPSCKQKVRVPREKRKIIVTCPKCHTEFQKRS